MLRQRVHLKTAEQIAKMHKAGQLVASCLVAVKKAVKPGVTTGELDAIVEQMFAEREAQSLFKGYPGKTPFPAVTCISVNEEVVHGIPGDRVLQEGDLVSVDTGCRLEGWCGDSAITIPVGELSADKQRLWDVAEETLATAIREVGRQKKWSQVAMRMQEVVHQAGYSIVEQFVGHGIGQSMHEEPQVPNYVARNWMKHDFWLDEGLVIAIEPMVNMGGKAVRIRRDHWTVETVDQLPSVHVEHTVAITADGPKVLTARDEFE
ncbi:Methionine aminopeptidase 1 [Planctomycetes bacterium Pan216]|uniref:Methionine aminopeptidase n=1 Tax=Kolteria novifilia TaxID=2527975 RepID=A0A518AZN9_9BACT|nr:Methionine aminopeptidase 1 [Planctomycetes bacterium Pan216]